MNPTPTVVLDGNLDSRSSYGELEYTRSGIIVHNVNKLNVFLMVPVQIILHKSKLKKYFH